MLLFLFAGCSPFVKVERIGCDPIQDVYGKWLTKEQKRLYGDLNTCSRIYKENYINRNRIEYMSTFYRHRVNYTDLKKGNLKIETNIPYCKIKIGKNILDVKEQCKDLK